MHRRGAATALAADRAPVPGDEGLGSLVFHSGGPGASGLTTLAEAPEVVQGV
ncbi:hypothetical protein [Streptomyces sp. NPDC048442]|uniref:hypothetical protein n=1 Tax=Streptomyces sp. NPDC048442 TaxID=3154823 RepID=UPI00344A6899